MANKQEIECNIDKWVAANLNGMTFRPYQKEIIVSIIENVLDDNGHKNDIIQAPTGSGKSIIAVISSGVLFNYYKRTSYILCSDLFLWNQYAKLIYKNKLKHFGMLTGQIGNYTCIVNNEDIANAECKVSGHKWGTICNRMSASQEGYECSETCVYVRERLNAINSGICLMTYQLFLNYMSLPKKFNAVFQERNVIFCDECHNIPSIVQNSFTPTIIRNFKNKIDTFTTYCLDNGITLSIEANRDDVYDENDRTPKEKTQTSIFNNVSKVVEAVNQICASNNYEVLFNELCKQKSDDEFFNDLKKMESYVLKLANAANDVIDEIKIHKNVLLLKNSKNPQNWTKTAKSKASVDNEESDMNAYKLANSILNFSKRWCDFIDVVEYAGVEYIVKEMEYDEYNGVSKPSKIAFNCVKEDWLCYVKLVSHARNRVFLSATVGGVESFSQNIGIGYTEEKNCRYREIPSTFNFSSSPIYFINKYKMSQKELNNSFPHLLNMINSICEKFKDQKGIIQTGSYRFAEMIYNNVDKKHKKRMLLYNGAKDKDKVVMEHKNGKDTILIGPTVYEGVDLPDDLCRFIIIAKVPYPSLGSKLVKKKQEMFPLWYNATASTAIIQGIGRGVRNANDYCVTYILDACFDYLYKKTKAQYPIDIQRRIKIV